MDGWASSGEAPAPLLVLGLPRLQPLPCSGPRALGEGRPFAAGPLSVPSWVRRAVSYRRLRLFAPRHLPLLLWSCVMLGQAPGRQWLAG